MINIVKFTMIPKSIVKVIGKYFLLTFTFV
jgi:hypothetical protein